MQLDPERQVRLSSVFDPAVFRSFAVGSVRECILKVERFE
jgi:hypothetical protein